MSTILIVVRTILSLAFLVAGLSKLVDLSGSRKSLEGFGFPGVLAKPGSILLPLVELAVALALLFSRFAWYGALGALALLTLFVLTIAVTLVRGRRPDCNCFGRLHSKPIGGDLIVRNVALSLLPALVIYSGSTQPSIPAWIGEATASQQLWFMLAAIGVAVVASQSVLIFQLIQQGGRVLLRLDEMEKRLSSAAPTQAVSAPKPAPPQEPGLPVGSKAPSFVLADLHGEATSLDNLLVGAKPVLLLFVHPGCGPCAGILKEAEAWQRTEAAHFRLAVISQGSRKDNLAKIKGLRLEHYLLQEAPTVSDAFQTGATPSAVMIGQDKTVISSVMIGVEAIRFLVAGAINQSVAGLVTISLKEGDVVPALVYPNLEGKMVSLGDFKGEPSMLLFWNTGCGYCQQMLTDLKAWETDRSVTRMILISGSSSEENRKMGLKSTVLLDRNFSVGRVFGASGTPSALLLDGDGKIVSKLAVGRSQIIALNPIAAVTKL